MDFPVLRTPVSPSHRTPAAASPPLTSTVPRTPERRLLAVLTAAVAVVLPLSACSGLTDSVRGGDEARTWEFDAAAAGKRHHVVPAWVPDDATGVRVASRRGGREQILTMRADLADLPDTCVPVSAENPLAPHPDAGDGGPSDFRSVSTLRADWWPKEVEQQATVMCGSWWVAAEGGALYAFTPELRRVAVG